MHRPAVELSVGGQTYRVRATAEEGELQRLANVVDARLREIAGPDRALSSNQLVLVALTLAHELEEERTRRAALERTWQEKLEAILARIDTALDDATEVEHVPDDAGAPRRASEPDPARPR